ncbi:MAG: response regulator [Pseudomonadota bacterium]
MIKTVLFVDDDAILCMSVQRYVQKHIGDFTLITAGHGREAMDILARETISMVVTDLQMPEMDGFELLARMSGQYPEIPVVIITAFNSTDTRQKGLSAGAVGYIEKPIDVGELAARIVDALADQSEGGVYQAVPLETMAQLIGMERKSCALRVTEKRSGGRGLLLFRDGRLIDARHGDAVGVPAAVDIFCWDFVQMDIEESLPDTQERIPGGLEAILELAAAQRP